MNALKGHACLHHTSLDATQKSLRQVLWLAFLINAVMFLVEGSAGLLSHSVSLQADALDFLGDSATYALSLFVVSRSLRWRTGAALIKGTGMALFGIWVIGATLYSVIDPAIPSATTMGSVGALALAANVACALLLFRFRGGDANMRSVWLCSRNDALGNVAVMAAATGVFASGTHWPDIAAAAILATLSLSAAFQVLRQATAELRQPAAGHADAPIHESTRI